jgi:hypothetical protein
MCDRTRNTRRVRAELATTRKFLERMPDERLTWRPHEKSMTAGQLALHIAQTPEGVLTFALPMRRPRRK